MSQSHGDGTPPVAPMLTVAVEVSARRGGSHAAGEFVAFAAAALDDAPDVVPIEWSVRALPRARRHGAALHHAVRARVGERAASLGLPITTRMVAPAAQVVFQASGALALRATPPGVVTVLRLEGAEHGTPSRRRLDRLRRAAGAGVVLHVPTEVAADALADALGVERAAIAVAAPGVRAVRPVAEAQPDAVGPILVLQGESPTRDRAVLGALQAAGATAQLVVSPNAVPAPSCCVVASPDAAFPLAALEALAAGVAVVAARTPATSELLEGAAALVDAGATQDFVEVAVELDANAAARAIAIAAGRVRAEDFSWARRSGDLLDVVRRSVAWV